MPRHLKNDKKKLKHSHEIKSICCLKNANWAETALRKCRQNSQILAKLCIEKMFI